MPAENEIPSAQILVVDDEVDHAEVVGEALRRMGHVCTIVHNVRTAEDELRHGHFDLIVTDLVMEGEQDGLKVLELAKQHQPAAPVIFITAHGDIPTCKMAMKQGAYDYIEKPLDLDDFRFKAQHAIQAVSLREENAQLRERLDEHFRFEGIIGSSPEIHAAIKLMRQIAPSSLPVLITGESGSGKELVAQAIHNNSRRAKKHFVPVNCAGLSESLLEDELFGHVRGAFTGADRDRQGRFEYADGGTLFLDEVGDMPPMMQAKLLRVLESGEVVRVGSNEAKHVDVRLISATNRKLEDMVHDHAFREDLYFRIRGSEIHMPALRERREDIALLVRHFVEKFAKEMGRPVPKVAEETQAILTRFDWPGNVRQLINVVQNMIVVSTGDTLEPRHVPEEIKVAGVGETAEAGPAVGGTLSLAQREKQAIREALAATGGNREEAAKLLGIGERTLYRKLKEYGLK